MNFRAGFQGKCPVIAFFMICTLEPAITVASLNVRGFNMRKKQYQVQRLLESQKPDFLAMQETKMAEEEQVTNALKPFLSSYEVCVTHAVGLSGGCFLFLKKSLSLFELSVTTDMEGRFILCDFLFAAVHWRLICVYAPNTVKDRVSFFSGLRRFVDCKRTVVLCGDFNCVVQAIDRLPSGQRPDRSATILKELLEDFDLVDAGSVRNETREMRFTHFQASSHARLDRIYVSASVAALLTKYRVTPVFFSDHCLVATTIGNKARPKAKFEWKLWKLNTKLLDDGHFVKGAGDIFKSGFENAEEDIFEAWETAKQEVKMLAIERSSLLAHEARQAERSLNADLLALSRAECANPGVCLKDLDNVKERLEQLHRERYRGAVVRARAEKYLMGEQPTKRALADEKRYAVRNEIAEIEVDGVTRTCPRSIQQAFVAHYKQLFESPVQGKGAPAWVKLLEALPQLAEEEAESLSQPITLQEVERAIDDLPNSKTPGPDGISAEFFKKFKGVLASLLLQVFGKAYERKMLPPSYTRTHTVFIPKSDDVAKLRRITGYRPITLCNVDYKVFAKILARRFQSVACKLIGEHQTCGIQGRSITTNVHVARSVLEACDAGMGQVAMLQIDLDKAFDRVRHDVLFDVLNRVNVGDVILEGAKMAYKDCTTRLVINKEVTEPIFVRTSVRQGCPMSPLLFNLYLELFCLSVLNSKDCRGFRLENAEVKVISYADDVAVFSSDKKSVSAAVSLAKAFCDATGAAINWDKCRGFWHGAWATTPSEYEGVSWDRVPCAYLGVPLNCYRSSKTFWSGVAADLDSRASRWKHRDLSIFARAAVCNIFLISKMWYVLQAIHCARVNVQKFHRVFALFIWGSNWEPMRRDNLFHRVRHGGLGLSHLFVKQLVSRFFFLRDQEQPFIRTFIQTKLSPHLPSFLVSSCGVEPTRLVGFQKEVVESVRFLSARFSLEYLSLVSKKALARDLVVSLFPTPMYRTLFCNGGHDVLNRVKRMCVPHSVKTFFFKLHTNTLPVKVWLREKGIDVPWTVDCLLCKQPETIEHVFIFCMDAVFFWDVLQRTLKKELRVTPSGIRFLDVTNDDCVPFDMFFLLGLCSIWRSRMAVRHADPNVKEVRFYFFSLVKQVESVFSTREPKPGWLGLCKSLLEMRAF